MEVDENGRMPVQFLDSNDGDGVTDCPCCHERLVIEFEDDGIYVSDGTSLADLLNQFLELLPGGDISRNSGE